jgi:hypothetical protein
MFISDLNYLQEVESNQVQGGLALALGSSVALASGPNFTSTNAAAETATQTVLIEIFPGIFAPANASGSAAGAASASS